MGGLGSAKVYICAHYCKFQLEKSESVLIVGGGAVGVELAGEIAETYPDKKVTLVHSGTTLVTMEFGQKFQDQINAAIEKYQENVKVIKGNH